VTYGPAREDGGIRIAPSILSADFATLADDVARVRAEADLLHVDIMDAHFVPALTIGPPVVASLRKHTDLFLDCHLMVDDPEVQLLAGNLPASLTGLQALILNDREARGLAGTPDREEAARHLASLGTTVVVTCGSGGAFAARPDGGLVHSEGSALEVDDPTGAGDLFTAAYVWSDLDGRSLDQRLSLANRYASMSLAEATLGARASPAASDHRQKGVSLEQFQQELAEQGRSRSWAAESS
jgi:hypothetical protein